MRPCHYITLVMVLTYLDIVRAGTMPPFNWWSKRVLDVQLGLFELSLSAASTASDPPSLQ